MGRALLLVGRPGIGKTTVIQKVLEILSERAGGFYTEEIRGRRGRAGFRLVTLDGQSAVMAHVKFRRTGIPRVSRYGVDVGAIDGIGVAAIHGAMQAKQVIIVDEIGKMELYCERFKDVVMRAIARPHVVVATVMSRSHAWVDALKDRPEVTVWQVTVLNRDSLAQQVVQWVDQPSKAANGVSAKV